MPSSYCIPFLFCATPIPPLPLENPQLDFGKAEYFSKTRKPGLEGVFSVGEHLVVKVRGAGNCFHVAATTGVIVWAVCMPGPEALQNVVARFSAPLQKPVIAFVALSNEEKVSHIYDWFKIPLAAFPRPVCLE